MIIIIIEAVVINIKIYLISKQIYGNNLNFFFNFNMKTLILNLNFLRKKKYIKEKKLIFFNFENF